MECYQMGEMVLSAEPSAAREQYRLNKKKKGPLVILTYYPDNREGFAYYRY